MTEIILEKRTKKHFYKKFIIWMLIVSAVIILSKFNLDYIALGFYAFCFWIDYWKK